ncbi:BMP family lipoprotein [Dethiothermospora halolimnae]|uniref:BMP family lipoprotein n=1 Tax=Dethiothermospora halolimnae TaxID=3114390 RepID=UPI003CCC444C
MFKKGLALLLSIMLVATLAVGCGTDTDNGGNTNDGDKTENGGDATGNGEEKISVAMVTDIGGVNDQSFNQSAWEGLQKAEKELGIKAGYQESQQETDYKSNLEQLLDANNDLIWGIGYKLAPEMKKAALNNPDQDYAIIDFSYGEETPENVLGVVFKAEQGSFLVGYIAGKMTETNKVGFVGGMKGEVIDGFDYGFHAGVKYANPDAEVLRQYAESFGDAAKGKAIAKQMYTKGADIVFHAAGGTGNGVIEAAKEEGKWAIGVDRDQNYLAPENVLTSAMKRVDVAIYAVTEDYQNNEFKGGETVVYGLAEDAVGIAPTSDEDVPQEILDEVEEVKQKIIDGDIVVPYNEDTYKEFSAE